MRATLVGVGTLLCASAVAQIRGTQADAMRPPLAPQAVRALEKVITARPYDIETRSRLALHYMAVGSPKEISRHALYLVKFHPDAPVLKLKLFFLEKGPLQDTAGYNRAKTLWKHHLETSTDPTVLDNAVEFLQDSRDPYASELWSLLAIEKGASRDKWQRSLAGLYATHILSPSLHPAFSNYAKQKANSLNDGKIIAEMAVVADMTLHVPFRNGLPAAERMELGERWTARARALGTEPKFPSSDRGR